MDFKIEARHFDVYKLLHTPSYLEFLPDEVKTPDPVYAEIDLLRPVTGKEKLKRVLSKDTEKTTFHYEVEGDPKPRSRGRIFYSSTPTSKETIAPRSESEWVLFETIENVGEYTFTGQPNLSMADYIDLLSVSRWNSFTKISGIAFHEVVAEDKAGFVAARFELFDPKTVSRQEVGKVRVSSRVDRIVRPDTHFRVIWEIATLEDRLLVQGLMHVVSIHLETLRPQDLPKKYFRYFQKQ